jgi:hypothetical protein
MIEPVDVFQGGQFELVEAVPRAVPLHQLSLVQPVHRLGECVVMPGAQALEVRACPDTSSTGSVSG